MFRTFWKARPKNDASALAQAQAEALSEARAKREAAWRAYREAKAREDSRSVGAALKSFRHATNEVVRLELAR